MSVNHVRYACVCTCFCLSFKFF
uniref:Predicted protein n=1 Tax=Hordeum vulgare subsp. vulgare TaxID=112509 RepID=F2DK97_HORVV|nr:predicted protein [Hordeum vulgare subsp. vulgare]